MASPHTMPLLHVSHSAHSIPPPKMTLVSNRPLVIPAAVLAIDAPSLNAKALLADILDLYKLSQHVFARDDYFAERYQVSKRSIGDALKWLEDHGWITRPIDNSARNKRNLVPTEQATALLEKSLQNLQPLPEDHAESATSDSRICNESMQNLPSLHADFADINHSLNKKGNHSLNTNDATGERAEEELKAKEKNTTPVKAPSPEATNRAAAPEPDDFQEFWDLYDHKKDRFKSERKWKSLNKVEQAAAIAHVPAYVQATPEKRFRKDPLTYLNGRCWLDEHLPAPRTMSPAQATTTAAPRSLNEKLKVQRSSVPI